MTTRRLPPEVEGAITNFREQVEAATYAVKGNPKAVYLGLESAILAACDAAERRGIERAAQLVNDDDLSGCFGARMSYREALGITIRSLPVPEEGANG